MLGHKLAQLWRDRFEVWVAVRQPRADDRIASRDRTLTHFDARSNDAIVSAIDRANADVVINCVGLIKQSPLAHDTAASLEINALFPHRLATACAAAGARMIHMSTDCVFSGIKGNYVEDDTSDAADLYGRTKYLGEVTSKNVLTIRSSIIGRELRTSHGLVEWFLSHNQNNADVRGWTNAIYSGFPTVVFADVLAAIVDRHAELDGIYHIASNPIDKYTLLCLLRDAFKSKIAIEPSEDVRVDRSLDGSRFRKVTGFAAPPWPEMIRRLAEDPTPYAQWRC